MKLQILRQRPTLAPGKCCLFPMWEHSRTPTQEFCGASRASGTRMSYCEFHRIVCTIVLSEKGHGADA